MLIPRPSYVEFVVDKVAMEFCLLLALGFSPVSTISPIPFVCQSCYIKLTTDVVKQRYPKQHARKHAQTHARARSLYVPS